MHIQTINYTRTFNLGNYSSEKIGVEFALNPGESADKALDNARQLVEEYHKKSVKQIEEAGSVTKWYESGRGRVINFG